MTNEQIEKAAGEISYHPFIEIERQGFIRGANWRIESVWHNIEEKANFLKLPILLQHKNGNIHFLDDRFSNWKYLQKYYTKWAYVKDLIP